MFDEKLSKLLGKYQEFGWTVFRVIVAVIFLLHGLMKFGVPGGKVQPFMIEAGAQMPNVAGVNLFFVAGVIEVVVGALLIIGLCSRMAAILGALNMIGALVIAHLPKGFYPLGPAGGETAWLYLAAFITIATMGAGKWSIDAKIRKKKA